MMSAAPPIVVSLIPSSPPPIATPSPPKLSISPPLRPSSGQQLHPPSIKRRDAVILLSFLSSVPSLCRPLSATAFSIGISGPKDWLREQKKKSFKFLLAPIDASRNSLRAAYLLLTKSDHDYANKDSEEVQRLFISAARDCVPEERNSFVTFQASTGVEVCTFQLLVKNASSLLGDKDPVKLEAEAKLRDLVRSFTSLNAKATEIDIQLPSSRKQIAGMLMDTISSLDKFEQGIKDCLEI